MLSHSLLYLCAQHERLLVGESSVRVDKYQPLAKGKSILREGGICRNPAAKPRSEEHELCFHCILRSKIYVPLLLRLWSAVTRMESKNDLHKVKCPTLLLIGDHAHHGTNLDNPKAVNQAIFEFINKIN